MFKKEDHIEISTGGTCIISSKKCPLKESEVALEDNILIMDDKNAIDEMEKYIPKSNLKCPKCGCTHFEITNIRIIKDDNLNVVYPSDRKIHCTECKTLIGTEIHGILL